MQSKNSNQLGDRKRSIKPKDLLFDLFDRVVDSLMAFERHPIYRVSKEEYAKRMNSSFDSRAALFYLKKSGLIKKVVEGKERYYELTPKGHKIIAWKKIENVGLNRSEKWDKYFRIVMFDVPNNKSTTRDAIRRKLEAIGFIQMQRSVFVYPFECKKEIEAICYYYSAGKYLKYMIANIIEGEKELIEKFLDMGVLTLEDLK
mgnify:FL=1